MIRDPVCLMSIDPRTAAAMVEHDGRTYYFCSAGCHDKFVAQPRLFLDKAPGMRLTVGVMGAADDDHPEMLRARVRDLGRAIAARGYILVTGACPGLPYECARGARAAGGLSVGISPALSLDEHVHKYLSPSDVYDVLIYTGSGLMGREVTNIRSSDMVVIVGGRSGTLGEFAIAYDEGKLIGVLEGTGGITATIPEIVAGFGGKDTGARLVYDADPAKLVQRLAERYTQGHYRHPSCFCGEYATAAG
jgi:uncharacterized protein (TIGR00725 family)